MKHKISTVAKASMIISTALLVSCQKKGSEETEMTQQETTDTSVENNIGAITQEIPGGLAQENTPQFVLIGADDCGDAETIQWILDFVNSKKNPDDTPLKMAFYVNGTYADDAGHAWKAAYEAGHEIGNHTFSHFLDEEGGSIDARLKSADVWEEEILKNDTIILEATGMSIDELVGFRVPRLEYNRAGFEMIAKRGFLYDCSIEEGVQEDMDPTNYLWPYTMENGSPSDSIQATQSVGESDWGYKEVGAIANLWQIPVYYFIVPDDSLAETYGFEPGLRERIYNNFDWFDTTSGKLTGFDYNIFAPADWSGAAMTATEMLATLKHSFDLHLEGNRTPFTLGMHPDFYSSDVDEYYKSAGNAESRRAVIEEFVEYALTHESVRFVTGAEMIDWMKNPVGLDQL